MSRLDPDYLDLLEALANAFANNQSVDGFLTGYCFTDWRKAKAQAYSKEHHQDLRCSACYGVSFFLQNGVCPDCLDKR